MFIFVHFVLALALDTAAFGVRPNPRLNKTSRKETTTILGHYWRVPEPPPGPLVFTGTKLVHDEEHPWMPPTDGDVRGPCPGLNTLASHGYIPRSGIATPAQIIHACQEAFNFKHSLAIFATYAAFLVDGNPLTNLVSIGRQTSKTGSQPPPPAIVGGMNAHVLFEGDASMTREDFFFGDNHSFNQTLFDELVEYSATYGAGKYNLTVASELKWKRIRDSITTNPSFNFHYPRYFTLYAEAAFPVNVFVDGRRDDGQLDLDVALGFFRDMRMPPDFHRARRPVGAEGMLEIARKYHIPPGSNEGIGKYVADGNTDDLPTLCPAYEAFVGWVKKLYPNPTGDLRKALIINLQYFYSGTQGKCTQQHPYSSEDA